MRGRGQVLREDSKDISAKKTPKVKLRVRYNLTYRFVSKNLPEYDNVKKTELDEKSFPILSVKCIIAFAGGGGNLRPNISIWREVSTRDQGQGGIFPPEKLYSPFHLKLVPPAQRSRDIIKNIFLSVLDSLIKIYFQ